MKQVASARLTPPAIALIVTAVLTAGQVVVFTIFGLVDAETFGDDTAVLLIMAFWGLLCLGGAGLMILGAVHMMRVQSYALCLTGAILPAIPCLFTGYCALIAVPVAIWCLIALANPETRDAFGRSRVDVNAFD